MLNLKLKEINKPQQIDIFEVMANPDFYPHPVAKIEIKETHISKVFLTGDYVYKVKKAVKLAFLDYTSLAKRKFYCQQETLLNRRLSQNVYLDVVTITQKNGRYFLDGPGQIVEYAVKMRQLPERFSLKTMLREGKIDQEITEELAVKLAEFYAGAFFGKGIDSFGAVENIMKNCEENFFQLQQFTGKIIDKNMLYAIWVATQSFLKSRKQLFERRINEAKIRDCHGDLRCGHIYFPADIQVIDCIEFNERFRYSDIAADLAFLIMDLDFEGAPKIASHLLNCVVRNIGDPDIYILIDFYKCYRSLVRAKVYGLLLEGSSLGQWQEIQLYRKINRYMKLACRYAQSFIQPTIWVVCGMVASGKSTVALELSGRLGVEVLQSDLIRKNICGLQPEDFTDVSFEEGIYSKEISLRTYDRLFLLAREEIEKGASVVLDATFSTKETRTKAQRLADNTRANIVFVECTAPENILKARLLDREIKGSLSDARIHLLDHFKERFEPLDELPEAKQICIDTQFSLTSNLIVILSQYYDLRSNT